MTREEEFDRLPQTIQMRQDLHDPARRIAVREEYKRGLPGTYPDLLEQVQLTEAQRDALFDLLADFQMRHLDIYYAKEPDQRARQKRFQENDQRRNEAVHSLLGPDVLETYRRYQLELPERQWVAWFARWLGPADGLSPEQKSQLMAVLRAERNEQHPQREERLMRRLRAVSRAKTNPAESLEADLRADEDTLREVEEKSRRLLQHVASFLSASQLAAFTRMENQKIDGQRRWVDSMRTQRMSADPATQSGIAFATARRMEDPQP